MNKSSFFTTVLGSVSALGILGEIEDRAGLTKLAIEALQNGSSNYKNKFDFFTELESLGAILSLDDGFELTTATIRVPWENQDKAKELLNDLLNNTKIDEEELDKLKKRVRLERDDLVSDPRRLARYEFLKQLFNTYGSLGTEKSFENINVEKVNEKIKQLEVRSFNAQLTEDKRLRVLDQSKFKPLRNTTEHNYSDFINLKRDFPQKVIYWGVDTKGVSKYNFWASLVARNILYRPLGGLVYEYIRKNESAAYYAFAQSSKWLTKGYFYISSGVSEDNVVKAVRLILKIKRKIIKGEFDKEIDEAKGGAKLGLAHTFDDPVSLYSLYAKFIAAGLFADRLPSYKQSVKAVDDVSKEQILEYFINIFNKPAKLLVAGVISLDNEKKLKEIIKNSN